VDGVPVHQIDPAVLRSSIGLALQGADLFHGTIRSNIALAEPGAPDEDVLWAARAAGALDWILRLPKGFETPVRERGAGLSGGQRQSVALARALFKRPKIVLLDEPTSDMDLGTELHVVQSLGIALQGRTLIAVSHRPAVLALVDRLIVMDQGRTILDGPKEDVLRKIEAMTAERTAKAKLKPGGGAA
jgi:ATP-binding cassette subfamily C protein LapB